MKRIFALILLAVFAATAPCQEPNARLRQLEDYLQQLGFKLRRNQKNNIDGSIIHQWSVSLHIPFTWVGDIEENASEEIKQLRNRMALSSDSINSANLKRITAATDSIRLTFALLSKEASESYNYEYHKNGKDTIKYALAFSKDNDTLYFSQYRGSMNFSNAREAAYFDYDKGIHNAGGLLRHIYTMPDGISWDNMQPFDITAFEALIQPVLKPILMLNGVKSYPVYWRHDEGFKDKADLVYHENRYSMYSDNKHTGLTTGVHYFIPAKYKVKAEALYRQLDSLAHNYIDQHPEQPYSYNFTSYFPYRNLGSIVNGCSYKGSNDYSLKGMRDKEGNFHILSISTKDELWIPSDWPILKSWINGEKVYLKGMAPKKNKEKK